MYGRNFYRYYQHSIDRDSRRRQDNPLTLRNNGLVIYKNGSKMCEGVGIGVSGEARLKHGACWNQIPSP